MSAFLRTTRNWLRGQRTALFLVALAGAGLLFGFACLSWRQQLILWGLLLAAVAVAARQGGVKLVGPVLLYDLVRAARRPRFVVARTLYALLIACGLCWLFVTVAAQREWHVPSNQMARFANNFFYAILVIQLVAVVSLTPAYTAGAIAEEKERKTLEFLLVTDLSDREIVLHKVASRLLTLGLLLLAGVPILSFLQFLGGIDLGTMLAADAATALTAFSLAGLSMLNSVLCRRARDAIVLTYVMVVAYGLLAGGAWLGKELASAPACWPGLVSFPSTTTWTSPVTLGNLVDKLNEGNMICAVLRVWRGAKAREVFEQDLPGKLGRYATFHALVGIACLGWSISRLRSIALREEGKPSAGEKGTKGRVVRRPGVGRHAMIWKEFFVEGGLRLNAPGRVVIGLLFLASFLPAARYLWLYVVIPSPRENRLT